MKASAIPAHEQSFVDAGLDSNGKQFKLTEVTVNMTGDPSGPLKLIDIIRQNNDKSFYYEEVVDKKRIVVHFTEGYLKGDIATLTKPGDKVSVPFIVARDGRIYNLWTSKYWSYHLGSGAKGGNTEMSKSSVAIELSNIGPLKKIGDNLVTEYSDTDVYCALTDTQLYTKLDTPYRGYSYYATFTDAQYKSLITLLRFLTAKYNIPRKFLNEPDRYNLFATDAVAKASTGILTHVNFRAPGEKVDIGPAFDWNRVIQGVTA